MFHLVNDIHMKQLWQTSFSIMLSCQELVLSIWSDTFFYAYTLCFVKVHVLLSFEVCKLLHFICIFFYACWWRGFYFRPRLDYREGCNNLSLPPVILTPAFLCLSESGIKKKTAWFSSVYLQHLLCRSHPSIKAELSNKAPLPEYCLLCTSVSKRSSKGGPFAVAYHFFPFAHCSAHISRLRITTHWDPVKDAKCDVECQCCTVTKFWSYKCTLWKQGGTCIFPGILFIVCFSMPWNGIHVTTYLRLF